jgi:hypothetical protein
MVVEAKQGDLDKKSSHEVDASAYVLRSYGPTHPVISPRNYYIAPVLMSMAFISFGKAVLAFSALWQAASVKAGFSCVETLPI